MVKAILPIDKLNQDFAAKNHFANFQLKPIKAFGHCRRHTQTKFLLQSISMMILSLTQLTQRIALLNRVPSTRRCQRLDGGLPKTSVRDAVLHVRSAQHSACRPLFGATDHSTAPPLLS